MNSRLMKYIASTSPTVRKKYSGPWPRPRAGGRSPRSSGTRRGRRRSLRRWRRRRGRGRRRRARPPCGAPVRCCAAMAWSVPFLLVLRVSSVRWLVAMPRYMIVSSAKISAWIAPMNRVSNGSPDQRRQEQRHLAADLAGQLLADDGDHDDEQSAREEVPEESERERDRLGDLLDDVDRRHHRERLGVVLEVPAEAALLEGEVLAVEEDRQRHRERAGSRPSVGAGRTSWVTPDLERRRDELEPVAHEDEEEEHHADPRRTCPLLSEHRARELARPGRSRNSKNSWSLPGTPDVARPACPPAHEQHDRRGDERRDDDVGVEGEPEDA